jgi:hypothetical protein
MSLHNSHINRQFIFNKGAKNDPRVGSVRNIASTIGYPCKKKKTFIPHAEIKWIIDIKAQSIKLLEDV